MKFDVKQMQNWNCYAYYAEDVPAEYWDYFRDDLWWQLGNGFIKTFDNVEDFLLRCEFFQIRGNFHEAAAENSSCPLEEGTGTIDPRNEGMRRQLVSSWQHSDGFMGDRRPAKGYQRRYPKLF